MAAEHTREGKFKQGFGGVAIAAAVAAYFSSPLLKFSNPVGLWVGGLLTSLGLVAIYNAFVLPGIAPIVKKIGMSLVFLGGYVVVQTFVFAADASRKLDKHCAILEENIIAGSNSEIAAAKDVFQALGCRPGLAERGYQ